MQNLLLEPDPRGDVLLTVRRPNLQQLVWSSFPPVSQSDHQVDVNVGRTRAEPTPDRDIGPEPDPVSEFEPGSETEGGPDGLPTAIEELDLAEPAVQLLGGDKAPTENSLNDQAPQNPAPLEQNDEFGEVHFRLSSRHLSLASPVFNSMLYRGWKESANPVDRSTQLTTDKLDRRDDELQPRHEIVATEWDTEAFLLLMNIIHGHHRQVPRSVDIETLGKLSILVDYYECHEIAEVFVHLWVNELSSELPHSYGRLSTIWLFVSWVFSRADIFEKMTELAMKESEGPLETMCLPLPTTLLTAIQQKRTNSLRRIVHILRELREGLVDGQKGCSDECSAMLLGSLIREMANNNFREDQLQESLSDRSIKQVKSVVLSFKTPAWCRMSRVDRYYSGYQAPSPHHCKIRGLLESAIDSVWEDLNGLRLDDYQVQQNSSAEVEPRTPTVTV